jgi:hypothetical protein
MISATPPKNANCNDSIWLVIRELFCYSSSVTGSGRWLVDGVADKRHRGTSGPRVGGNTVGAATLSLDTMTDKAARVRIQM